jgi:hypothetical protein
VAPSPPFDVGDDLLCRRCVPFVPHAERDDIRGGHGRSGSLRLQAERSLRPDA